MKKLIIFLSILTISNNKVTKYCDIKGNVNNPGVYEIKDNYTIQDLINEAGGLKKNSYTNNINLSKKVTDEMVIYINTKEEITKLKNLNNCDCSPKYEYIECVELNDSIEESMSQEFNNSIIDKKNEITTTKTIDKPDEITTIIIDKDNITTTTTTNKTTTTTTKVIENKIININTCSLEDLINLKGLGEKKATNIIEYRELIGTFETIEEIMNVSGIGESTFNVIKEFIEV